MQTITVDCTELFQNPVRTGVQRVVRELLRNWPKTGPHLRVARFVAGEGLVGISEKAIEVLKDTAPGTAKLSHSELVARIASFNSEIVKELPSKGVVFIPEVFYDRARSAFYQDLAHKRPVAVLCADFLIYLKPWLFELNSGWPLMEYFRAIRAIPHVGHISNATRKDYAERIMRGRAVEDGPVLPLGADGFPVERQSWHDGRQGFVAIGSIDRRKNQHVIAAAFGQLWKDGHAINLTIVGRSFDKVDCEWIDVSSRSPHFRWIPDASDEAIATLLRSALATIYVSSAEGYGLPPTESLAAGVPVIVSADIPSLAGVQSYGQIRVPVVTEASIASAVLAMQDRETVKRLWSETALLRLGSWRDFATATVRWLDSL